MKKRNELSALSGEELISILGGYAPQTNNSSSESKNVLQELKDSMKWW